MRKYLVAAVIAAALLILMTPAASQPAASKPAPVASSANWTQAGGGPEHRSSVDIEIGQRRFGEVWSYQPQFSSSQLSHPVAADGVVCVAGPSGLEAVSARTGKLLWSKTFKARRSSEPVISGGRVVVLHEINSPAATRLRCYKLADGQQLWDVDVVGRYAINACDLVADDKNVYAWTVLEDGCRRLTAVNVADGATRFFNDRLWDVRALPASDGNVLAVCANDRLMFFDTVSGKQTGQHAPLTVLAPEREAIVPDDKTRLVMAHGRCYLTGERGVLAVEYTGSRAHWLADHHRIVAPPSFSGPDLWCPSLDSGLLVFHAQTGHRKADRHHRALCFEALIVMRDAVLSRQSGSLTISSHDGRQLQVLPDVNRPILCGEMLFAIASGPPRLVKYGLRIPQGKTERRSLPLDAQLPLQGDWPVNTQAGHAGGALAGREAVMCWERDLGATATVDCIAANQVFWRSGYDSKLSAMDALDGSSLWSADATGAWGPAAWSKGSVYSVDAVSPPYEGKTYCYGTAMDAATGEAHTRHYFGPGGEDGKSAPVPLVGKVWYAETAKYHSRISPFSPPLGPILPPGSAFASDGALVYAWEAKSREFHVLEASSGRRQWSTTLPEPEGADVTTLGPVIAGNQALVSDSYNLCAINLKTRTVDWTVRNRFQGPPAVAGTTVVVPCEGTIKLFSLDKGAAAGQVNFGDIKITMLESQPIVTDDTIIAVDRRATHIIDRKKLTVRQTLAMGGRGFAASGALFIFSPANAFSGETARLARYEFRQTHAAEPPQAFNIDLEAEEDEWVDFRLQGNSAADAGLIAYVDAPHDVAQFYSAGPDGLPERLVSPRSGAPVGHCPPKGEKFVRMFARLPGKEGSREPHVIKLKYVLSDGRRFSEPAFVTIKVHPRGALSTALELWTVENVPVTGKIAGLAGAAFPNAVLGTTMPRADGAFIYTPAQDRLDNDYFLVPGTSASGVQRVRINVAQCCDRQPRIASQPADKAKPGATWSYDFTLQCDDAVNLDAVKALIGGIAPPQIRVEGELKRDGRKLSGRLVWDKAWEGYENLSSVRLVLMAIDTAGRSGDVQWIELKRD